MRSKNHKNINNWFQNTKRLENVGWCPTTKETPEKIGSTENVHLYWKFMDGCANSQSFYD